MAKTMKTLNGYEIVDNYARTQLENTYTKTEVDGLVGSSGSGATAEQIAQIEKNKNDISELSGQKIDHPSTGQIGQILEIESVDENGKPKSYKAVDKPTGGGSVSGTTNYTDLENKPQINGIELNGNKTSEDLGIGKPSDEQVASSVSAWLDEHPEATTTVADGSIDTKKIADKSVTPDKTSFMRVKPDEYLWTIADFNLKETVKTNSDAEAKDCIYPGWYSDFKEYSGSEIWAVYNHVDGVTYPNYLKLLLLCYDADKNYLGKTRNFSKDSYYVKGKTTRLYLCLIPEGTAYVRFYNTEDQHELDFCKNARFYTAQVKENVVKLDENIVTAFIDGYDMFPMGATNLMKDNEFVEIPIISDVTPQTGFYVGTSTKNPASMFPMEVSGRTVYSLIKTNVETDGWRIKMRHSLSCFDENKVHIGSIGHYINDKGQGELLSSELLYEDRMHSYVKYTVPEGTKYITAYGDDIYVTNNMIEHIIISESEIPLNADPNGYRGINSPMMDAYTSNLAQKVVDNNNKYYRFTQVGRLLEQGDNKYVAWNHGKLHYDNTRNKFVGALRGTTYHGSSVSDSFFVEIEPLTYKASKPKPITDGTDTVYWVTGFVLDDSDNYILFGIIESNVSNTSQTYKFTSNDGGTTWVNQGAISVDTSNAPDSDASKYNYGKFFCMYRMSDGTLLASYDDTVSPVNGKYTMIARSIDDGVTWTLIEVTDTQIGGCECFFFEIDDTIIMLGRKNAYGNTPNMAVVSYSYDKGITWTKPFYSKTIENHAQCCTAFIHDDIVEVFSTDRIVDGSKPVGKINHYSCTKEQALNDKFLLREVFYSQSNSFSDLTGCSLAQDRYGNVLMMYSDSTPTSSVITSPHFLVGGKAIPRTPCCDGIASDRLPYSGAKVEEMFAELKAMITS